MSVREKINILMSVIKLRENIIDMQRNEINTLRNKELFIKKIKIVIIVSTEEGNYHEMSIL